MKDFFLLKLLDRFRGLFARFGVDYPVMRKILQVKLLMDERRVPTILSRNQNKEGKASYRSSLLLYAFIGLFVGLFLLPDFAMYAKMNLVFGMILFMIMTTMISDFSSVLLDVKDKAIVLTRPVQTGTLNAAKLIHIVYYLASITGSIAGVSLLIGLLRYGPLFFLLFLLELVLICVFVILLTSILYYVILRFFSGEKLKDIINYFQIILSVVMTLLYQLVGRMFNIASLNVHVAPKWWNLILPSSWFAAPFSLLVEHDFHTIYIVFSIAAVVLPLVALLLYVKVAAPAFERTLQKLTDSGGLKREMKTGGLRNTISKIVCRDKLERVFFRFAVQMMANERKLKLKLYPSLAFAVIMPFIFLLGIIGSARSLSGFFSSLSAGRYYIALYFSSAFLSPAILMLSMSENYKGAWIYRAMPVRNPAPAIRGAVKAFLYKYMLPVYLLESLIFVILWGPGILPSLLLIFLNMLVQLMVIFCFSKKELPFYKSFDVTQSGGTTAIVFLSLGLSGFFAVAHYLLLRFYMPGVYGFLAVSLLTVALLWHFGFRFTWRDIAREA